MHAKRLLLAAGCAVAVVAAPLQTYAQNVPTAPAAEKKPAASGVKSYEAGAKAFEAGKFGPAIQSLSTALSTGGLSSQQMAKALYYRGAAYRKTGKSAQAISDLTSAVWLKNGLSDADRAAAMEQRQAAYQEAGLGTATPIGTPPLDAPAAVANTTQPSPATPPATPAAAPADSATSSWSASSEKSAAEASVPNLSTPAGGYATLSSPDAPVALCAPSRRCRCSFASAAWKRRLRHRQCRQRRQRVLRWHVRWGKYGHRRPVDQRCDRRQRRLRRSRHQRPAGTPATSVVAAPAKADVKRSQRRRRRRWIPPAPQPLASIGCKSAS